LVRFCLPWPYPHLPLADPWPEIEMWQNWPMAMLVALRLIVARFARKKEGGRMGTVVDCAFHFTID